MIFKFRMVSGEVKDFLRDYEVDSTQTLLHFHKVIQKDLGYDSNQLASFFLTDENWGKGLEFTLIDMEVEGGPAAIPMFSVRICDIINSKKERLIYQYDLFSDKSFFLELIDVFSPATGVDYPVCSASFGNPPIQIDFNSSDIPYVSDDPNLEDIYRDFDSPDMDSSLDRLDNDTDDF